MSRWVYTDKHSRLCPSPIVRNSSMPMMPPTTHHRGGHWSVFHGKTSLMIMSEGEWCSMDSEGALCCTAEGEMQNKKIPPGKRTWPSKQNPSAPAHRQHSQEKLQVMVWRGKDHLSTDCRDKGAHKSNCLLLTEPSPAEYFLPTITITGKGKLASVHDPEWKRGLNSDQMWKNMT